MKKQNIIIVIILVLLIVSFYLFKFFKNKNDIEEEIKEPEITQDNDNDMFCEVYIYGEVYKSGTYKVPSSWTLEKLFELVKLKVTADISGFNLAELVENNKKYYIPKKNNINESDKKLININTASRYFFPPKIIIPNIITKPLTVS